MAGFSSQKTLRISAIEFDLGIKEADDVARKATRLKCGDVFSRDAIWRDLRSIFAALSTHWKTREAHTDWLGKLCAYPSTTNGDGVKLTIKVSPLYEDPLNSNQRALEPIFDRVTVRESKPNSFALWNPAEKKRESDDSNCHLGNTKEQREKQLQNFLNEKSHRYPGYDSETDF